MYNRTKVYIPTRIVDFIKKNPRTKFEFKLELLTLYNKIKIRITSSSFVNGIKIKLCFSYFTLKIKFSNLVFF